eukprot:351937-Chlamydomonas_euryale.AAC.9
MVTLSDLGSGPQQASILLEGGARDGIMYLRSALQQAPGSLPLPPWLRQAPGSRPLPPWLQHAPGSRPFIPRLLPSSPFPQFMCMHDTRLRCGHAHDTPPSRSRPVPRSHTCAPSLPSPGLFRSTYSSSSSSTCACGLTCTM